MTRLAWISLVFALGACGTQDPKAQGEECFGTSECADGLLCNTTLDRPVCTPGLDMLPVDAAVPAIDAPPDVIDAPPGVIDAPPAMIDAPPMAIDAAPIDAPPMTIDAALPDAAI